MLLIFQLLLSKHGMYQLDCTFNFTLDGNISDIPILVAVNILGFRCGDRIRP